VQYDLNRGTASHISAFTAVHNGYCEIEEQILHYFIKLYDSADLTKQLSVTTN